MTTNRSNAATSFADPELGRGDERAPGDGERVRIDEEREMLLRAIGHELRSPLTAMSLGIDLVRRGSPSKPRILDLMTSTVQRMDRMIDELLRVACSDSGATIPQREAVSVHVQLLKGRKNASALR